jgi:hypothetical protein
MQQQLLLLVYLAMLQSQHQQASSLLTYCFQCRRF